MIIIFISMPADSLSRDKYMVCSIDSLNDDISSGQSGSITGSDPPTYVDLKSKKREAEITTSNTTTATTPSPVPSTVMSDRWVSYWSKRERCCCFWNFLLTVSLAVMVTIMVLVTKGIVELDQPESSSNTSQKKLSFSETTVTSATCSTQKPESKMCTEPHCVQLSSEILAKVNLTEDPCSDFYSFACGGFVSNTKLLWSVPRRRTNPEIILQKHMDTLADILSGDIRETEDPDVRTIKTIYKLCMEQKQSTVAQVKEVIDSLGGMEIYGSPLANRVNISQLLTHVMVHYGVSPLFKVIVLPRRKIGVINRFSDELIDKLARTEQFYRYRFLKPSDYLYRNEETDNVSFSNPDFRKNPKNSTMMKSSLLQAYKKYIGDFLLYTMQLDPSVKSDKRFINMVDDVFHMDVYINRVLYTEDHTDIFDEVSKCERPMSIDDLQYHYNYNISWREVLTSILRDVAPINNYTVCFVSLSTGLRDVLSGFSYTSLKRYLIYSALTQSDLYNLYPNGMPQFSNAQWLDGAFSKPQTGQLDYVCIRHISQYIPLNILFKHRISDDRSSALKSLFIELNKSIENIIDNMYWVPIIQKQHLLGALNSLSVKLMWEQQYDISTLLTDINGRNETDNYFIVMRQLIKFRSDQYYKGLLHKNNIDMVTELVAGVLEISPAVVESPLFYDNTVPGAFYGAAGTVLAQTLSETFDITALLKFLTEDKIDHRVALTIAFRLQCLVKEYNNYELLSEDGLSIHVRGDLTKNANLKDSLAMRVAYNAYKRLTDRAQINLPGLDFTPDQLFFLTYAQTMCESVNTGGIRRYYIETEQTHISPGKYRVLGTLSNFKKFAEAFHCDVNSKMNPENKCSLF